MNTTAANDFDPCREQQIALVLGLLSKASTEPDGGRQRRALESACAVLKSDPEPTREDAVTVSYAELRALLQAYAQHVLELHPPQPVQIEPRRGARRFASAERA